MPDKTTGHVGDSWVQPEVKRPPRLEMRDVHVWRAWLDVEEQELVALESLLAHDERERAARFRFEEHRKRYVVARGILRTILGDYLAYDPARIGFEYGEHGKPRLAEPSGSRIEFNLSHSSNLAVFAIATGCSVGVDVEFIKPGVSCLEIAARYFSDEEAMMLRKLSETEMRQKFFELWSEKEARLKALGFGLHFALDQPQPGKPQWSVVKLTPAPGYAAALAVQMTLPLVSQFHFA